MWLHAVLPPSQRAVRARWPAARAEETIARLIRRADRYAARLSPRKSRPASSATAAAQVALLDEGGHTDEAGQALIRTLGLYPPGVWVKLQCGEIAMVLRRTRDRQGADRREPGRAAPACRWRCPRCATPSCPTSPSPARCRRRR